MKQYEDFIKTVDIEKCPFKDQPFVNSELYENSDILFIGEAPGRDEVSANKPFVGTAGKLLRNWLDKFDKSLVISITNTVDHWPPDNAKPSAKQAHFYRPWLIKKIRLTNPKLIVVLGEVAMLQVLGRKGVIKENGRIYKTYNPAVAVCVHPAFVLYPGNDPGAFDKGMLPVFHFFDNETWEYKEKGTVPPIETMTAWDIECSANRPHEGIIRCMAISNGKKNIFVKLTEEDI